MSAGPGRTFQAPGRRSRPSPSPKPSSQACHTTTTSPLASFNPCWPVHRHLCIMLPTTDIGYVQQLVVRLPLIKLDQALDCASLRSQKCSLSLNFGAIHSATSGPDSAGRYPAALRARQYVTRHISTRQGPRKSDRVSCRYAQVSSSAGLRGRDGYWQIARTRRAR